MSALPGTPWNKAHAQEHQADTPNSSTLPRAPAHPRLPARGESCRTIKRDRKTLRDLLHARNVHDRHVLWQAQVRRAGLRHGQRQQQRGRRVGHRVSDELRHRRRVV
eukprot:311805-Chlamydomonas_euryale.AAC.2